jgi:hypothetical protein
MIHPDSPPLPSWILKSNGRIKPFNISEISRDLYQATVKMGKPDAFLARELADGVSLLLANENPGATLSQDLAAASISRTIREFGYPQLAEAYEASANFQDNSNQACLESEFFVNSNLDQLSKIHTRQNVLKSVLTPDAAASIEEGWVQMEGITHPDGFLETAWLGDAWVSFAAMYPDLFSDELQKLASKTVHLFGPSSHANFGCAYPKDFWVKVFNQCSIQSRSSGTEIMVHWNQNPKIAEVDCPLFSGGLTDKSQKNYDCQNARAFFEVWLHSEIKDLWFCWHLDENATLPAFIQEHLGKLKKLAIFRNSNAKKNPFYPILERITLRLDRLAKVCSQKGDLGKFQERLPSLVRLGLDLGSQKKQFLKKLEAERASLSNDIRLSVGFSLEKSRLEIVPFGLPEILERLFPFQGPLDPKPAKFCRETIGIIRSSVATETRKLNLGINLNLSKVLDNKESRIKKLAVSKMTKTPFKKLSNDLDYTKWCEMMALANEKVVCKNPKNWELVAGCPNVHCLVWD